jgi:hypothetical protein
MHTKKQYPQPYRYEFAKARFKKCGGVLDVCAPSGIDEDALNLLTEALELFSDTQTLLKEFKEIRK